MLKQPPESNVGNVLVISSLSSTANEYPIILILPQLGQAVQIAKNRNYIYYSGAS